VERQWFTIQFCYLHRSFQLCFQVLIFILVVHSPFTLSVSFDRNLSCAVATVIVRRRLVRSQQTTLLRERPSDPDLTLRDSALYSSAFHSCMSGRSGCWQLFIAVDLSIVVSMYPMYPCRRIDDLRCLPVLSACCLRVLRFEFQNAHQICQNYFLDLLKNILKK
jgi:hypothetical protein